MNDKNDELKAKTIEWRNLSFKHKYSYNFSWCGLQIIQYPQDLIAMQEIVWNLKPDLIIETGVAHGGSSVFYSSMLELVNPDGIVVSIEHELREHNRKAIISHPLSKRIHIIDASSVDDETIDKVNHFANTKSMVLVALDSNHTHSHVLKELQLYSKFVTVGSYIVVFDTFIEDMPDDYFLDRPWGKGNNPKTAVWEFLKSNSHFEIDRSIEDKILVTGCPDGFLKRIN